MVELTYTEIDGILYPNLEVPYPEYSEKDLTRYGLARKKYLDEEQLVLRTILGFEYWPYLIEEQNKAEEMHKIVMERKVREAEKSGELSETLRNENPMLWAQVMTRLENETYQQVMREVVYATEPCNLN